MPSSVSWRLCHTVPTSVSVWVCSLGERRISVHHKSVMVLQGFSAEAQMAPLAATGEKQWTAAMQEAVCTMHEQWRGEPEGSVGPETIYPRGQRAGENPAQPTLQDGAIGAQEAASAETRAAEV